MSDFATCIPKVATRLPKEVQQLLNSADDPNAVLDDYITTLTIQKKEAAFQAVRLAQAFDDAASHPEGLYQGIESLMVMDRTMKAGYESVDSLSNYYDSMFQARAAEILFRFRRKGLGIFMDEEGLAKFIRAVYGETTDDAEINALAKQWLELTEVIRREKNRNGASISKNERFLLPQNHDARALKKMGKDVWKEKIRPLLDANQMRDDAGNLLSRSQMEDLLDYVYDSITMHGLNKVKDLTVPKLGRKLSRRGSERRILYFKDADSWMSYQKEFGKGDIFTTLTDWVSSNAHDTALLRRMGPNPNQTYDALIAMAKKENAFKGTTKLFMPKTQGMLDAIFNVVSGKTNPVEMNTIAQIGMVQRNVISAAYLGSAFISAIGDVAFLKLTRQYGNIPTQKIMSRYMSFMNPANEADRLAAARIGIIAEEAIDRAHAANRFADVVGTGKSMRMADFVMRASLLKPHTESLRKAYAMEFSGMLADNFGKKFDDLDPDLLKAFEVYGIGPSEWSRFSKTPKMELKGAQFADFTQPGGLKFHQMVMSEVDYAVPAPDSKIRAMTTGGLQRGTIPGEVWRSAMQIKSFPLTVASLHFNRGAFQATMGQKVGYYTQLMVYTTVLGGIALQAKDLKAGRDPRAMFDKDGVPKIEFLLAAMAQGGGGSLIGDFLYSDANRYGHSFSQTAMGPIASTTDDAYKYIVGNAQELVSEGFTPEALKAGYAKSRIGPETIKLLEQYSPSIWQVDLLKQSLFDQMEMAADPNAQKNYRRLMQKRAKEYNQRYWWQPGKGPVRAPELEAIIED